MRIPVKEISAIHKDEVQNVRQKEVRDSNRFINRMFPGDGHKVFEFNKKTFDITEITPNYKDLDFNSAKKGLLPSEKKVTTKNGCWYFSALNMKNAIKKVLKRYPHLKYIPDEKKSL